MNGLYPLNEGGNHFIPMGAVCSPHTHFMVLKGSFAQFELPVLV